MPISWSVSSLELNKRKEALKKTKTIRFKVNKTNKNTMYLRI